MSPLFLIHVIGKFRKHSCVVLRSPLPVIVSLRPLRFHSDYQARVRLVHLVQSRSVSVSVDVVVLVAIFVNNRHSVDIIACAHQFTVTYTFTCRIISPTINSSLTATVRVAVTSYLVVFPLRKKPVTPL